MKYLYPEGAAEGPVDDFSGGGGGIGSRIGFNLEAFIPIILIIIIGLLLAMKLGIVALPFDIPGISGGQPSEMLIIGASSIETLSELSKNPDLVHYRQHIDPTYFERNPADMIANYDIIWIDQSEQADKTIPRRLGEAIEDFVKRGGKLVVVKDSGILREGAYDVIGWEATFNDVVPVKCDRVIQGIPSCMVPYHVMGEGLRDDEDHRIMRGIERAPFDPNLLITVDLFDVTSTGKEVAFIRESGTDRTYPAIIEKSMVIGKSIYFNYNPGKTPGILANTLEYLR